MFHPLRKLAAMLDRFGDANDVFDDARTSRYDEKPLVIGTIPKHW